MRNELTVKNFIEEIESRPDAQIMLRSGYEIPKVFFNHIHKTGGGTLKRVLQQFYADPEVLTLSSVFIPQHELNDPNHPLFSARYDVFNEFFEKAERNGVRFLDTHQNFHAHIDKSWTCISFVRPPRGRLRSNLNAIFDPVHLGVSEDFERDTQLLKDGCIEVFLRRTDPFAIQVQQRCLNLMSREFLRDHFLRESDRGFYAFLIARAESDWLERIPIDRFYNMISKRADRFEIIGQTLEFDKYLAAACFTLGIPFQKEVRSVHVRSDSTKAVAEQIVSNINESLLNEFTYRDEITYKEFSRRSNEIKDCASAQMEIDLDHASAKELESSVNSSFLKKFRSHLDSSRCSPLQSFILKPSSAFLGWGLGTRRTNPKSPIAFFRMEVGATGGFFVHARLSPETKLYLIGPKSDLAKSNVPDATIIVNGVYCEFVECLPHAIKDVEMQVMCAVFKISAAPPQAESDIQKIEIQTLHREGFFRFHSLAWDSTAI